jgi:hypothetical protein
MTRSSIDATSEQGSTLLEFALVLTVLLTVLFGIMEFSRAMYAYHFLSNAAREATRYASVRGSTFSIACASPPPVVFDCLAGTSDIAAYVQSILAPGVYVKGSASASCASPSVGQLNVCASWPATSPSGGAGSCPATPSGGKNPGCLVQVEVLYTYGFTLPFVSKDLSSITMSSTSETVIQQ